MQGKLHMTRSPQHQPSKAPGCHMPAPRFTSVQHVLSWHVTQGRHASHPALLYGSPEGSFADPLTYNELNEVTTRLAAHYEVELGMRDCRFGTERAVVIGLYGNSSPAYLFTQLAVLKLNPRYIPFLLSPRNSPTALHNLCQTAGVSVILRGHESSFAAVTDDMLANKMLTRVLAMPTMKDVQQIIDDVRASERHLRSAVIESEEKHSKEEEKVSGKSDATQSTIQKSAELDPEATALILHSSGSTQAYPKVIRIPNRYVNALLNEATTWGLEETDVAYLTAPLFHAYGVFVLLGTLRTATTLALPAVTGKPQFRTHSSR